MCVCVCAVFRQVNVDTVIAISLVSNIIAVMIVTAVVVVVVVVVAAAVVSWLPLRCARVVKSCYCIKVSRVVCVCVCVCVCARARACVCMCMYVC